jgi:hypothetical protein
VNLKVMLVYSPDSFLLRPGFALLLLGLLISLPLSGGPISVSGIVFNLYWMLFGLTATTLGYSLIQVGVLARIMHGLRFGVAESFQRFLTYNRGMIIAAVSTCLGLVIGVVFVVRWIHEDLKIYTLSNAAVLGLLLLILGFQTFGFTLLLEMAQRVTNHSKEKTEENSSAEPEPVHPAKDDSNRAKVRQ